MVAAFTLVVTRLSSRVEVQAGPHWQGCAMAATSDPRPAMVEIAHLMYERRLTNAAGGNLSCRVGDYIYISPRYLGSKQRWKLREEMVLVFDKDYQIVEGDPAMVLACHCDFCQKRTGSLFILRATDNRVQSLQPSHAIPILASRPRPHEPDQ